MNDLLSGSQPRKIFHILPNGLAGDGHAIAVNQSFCQKQLDDGRHAADSMPCNRVGAIKIAQRGPQNYQLDRQALGV